MKLITRKNKKAAVGSPPHPPVKLKLWQHVSRRDKEAVKDIDIRRFCKRVKTVFTRRSEKASLECREAPRRLRLLRPLKHFWKNTRSEVRDKQASDKQPFQNKHNLHNYKLLSSSSSISAAEGVGSGILEVCVSKESQFSPAIERIRLSAPLISREPSPIPSVLSRVSLIETEPSPTPSPTILYRGNLPIDRDRLYTAPVKQRLLPVPNDINVTSSLRNPQFSQALVVVEHDPATIFDASFRSTRETVSSLNGFDMLPACPVIRDKNHPVTPSPKLDTDVAMELPLLESDDVEYQRLMRVFFRAPASRIPIPMAWRRATPRAYSFRGISSPFRRVVTVPVQETARNLDAALLVFATQPRRPACKRITSSILTPAVTLQDIVSRISSPQHVAIKEPDSHPRSQGHNAIPMLPRHSTRASSCRMRYVKTLPLSWFPTIPLANGQAMMREAYADGEETLKRVSRTQGGGCAVEIDPNDVESATIMSNEEFWFDALEIAVVDEPVS